MQTERRFIGYFCFRLEKHLPEQFEKVKIEEENAPAGSEDDKKRQKRGGKGMVKAKKKDDVPKSIKLSRAPRGKKKSVTVVVGLSTFGEYYDLGLRLSHPFLFNFPHAS